MHEGADMDTYRYGGEWHLPEAKSSYNGDLLVNEEKGVIHLLLYRVGDESDPFGEIPLWGETPMIFGRLVNGAQILLYGCETGKRQTEYMGRSSLDISVKYAFWGLQAREESELVFNEVQLDFGDIIEWSGICRYELDRQACSLKWISEPEIEISLKNRKIKILAGHSEPFGDIASRKYELDQRVIFSILPDTKWTIGQFMHDVYCLRNLISLGMQGNVSVEEMKYFHEQNLVEAGTGNDASRRIRGATVNTRLPRAHIRNRHPYDYLFSLQELLENPHYIDNWFDKYHRMKPIIDLCASVYLHPDIPAEVFFLNMAQALETYHSRFVCNDPQVLLGMIEDEIRGLNQPDDADKASSIKKFLWPECQKEYYKYITLSARLRYLVFANGGFSFYTLGLKNEDFIEKVVDSRNYYTHYDEKKADQAFAGKELDRANAVLWNVIRYYILKELGFAKEHRNSKIRKEQNRLTERDRPQKPQ